MADSAVNEKTTAKAWFKGLKAEFKKIIWPDKTSLVKQTAAVVVITVILGGFIALLDLAIKYGVGLVI